MVHSGMLSQEILPEWKWDRIGLKLSISIESAITFLLQWKTLTANRAVSSPSENIRFWYQLLIFFCLEPLNSFFVSRKKWWVIPQMQKQASNLDHVTSK